MDINLNDEDFREYLNSLSTEEKMEFISGILNEQNGDNQQILMLNNAYDSIVRDLVDTIKELQAQVRELRGR